MVTCVVSRLLYAAETWALNADIRRLLASEMTTYTENILEG